MKGKKRETKKPKKEGARPENDLFEEPNRDIYEETVYRLRSSILGDESLMLYCLEVAAHAAIESGEHACQDLLDCCDAGLVEALKVDCGDDPKAIVEEILHLAGTW